MVKNEYKKICKISISLADSCIFIQNGTLLPTGISFPIFFNEFNLYQWFQYRTQTESIRIIESSEELSDSKDPEKTHRFYWQKPIRNKIKPRHPGEKDLSLPSEIRGHHFDSWTELASFLGYGPKR